MIRTGLFLFNTRTRKKEAFAPLKPGRVGLYTCGPTVYNFAHIGNLRTYIFADILKRTLLYNRYAVRHIVNITDVGHLNEDHDFGEDKIEQGARREGTTPRAIARFYTKAFLADIKKLNIVLADVMPRATEHIKEQIEVIKLLFAEGYAYETEYAVYFNVRRFKRYFDFSMQKESDIKQAARGEVIIDKNKKHPADFALWLKRTGRYARHALHWNSPWGDGFPGWHIECSAMSVKYLSQPFDIHTGGVDHIFPHHTNEIAQSEAATNRPLARYWLHGEFLLVNNARMGKSQSNFITLANLETQHIDPLAYRYFVLLAHYRKKLNFTFEAVRNAGASLARLRAKIATIQASRHQKSSKQATLLRYQNKFKRFINDDLNIPRALATLWETLRSNELSDGQKSVFIRDADQIFGLNLFMRVKKLPAVPTNIQQLVRQRESLRKGKKWASADKIRIKIRELGWDVDDTKRGPAIKRR